MAYSRKGLKFFKTFWDDTLVIIDNDVRELMNGPGFSGRKTTGPNDLIFLPASIKSEVKILHSQVVFFEIS